MTFRAALSATPASAASVDPPRCGVITTRGSPRNGWPSGSGSAAKVSMPAPARWPEAMAAADPTALEEILRPTGFFRAKARSVLGLSAALRDDFGGEVPGRLEDLVKLPGVGRKTANVVLGNAFGVPGITVDTHFGRLSRRFGWTTSEDPEKVEQDVAGLFPKSEWTMLSHRLIFHGRRTCHSRRPACGACPVAGQCPSYGIGETDPEVARRLLTYELAPGTAE